MPFAANDILKRILKGRRTIMFFLAVCAGSTDACVQFDMIYNSSVGEGS